MVRKSKEMGKSQMYDTENILKEKPEDTESWKPYENIFERLDLNFLNL
jgi:hypothetical protein